MKFKTKKFSLIELLITLSFCTIIFFFLIDIKNYAQEKKDTNIDNKEQVKNKQILTNIDDNHFSPEEIILLKKLSERRKLLQEENERIQTQTNILNAIEKNIEKKIQQLQEIEKKIQQSSKNNNTNKQNRLKSFVKIYENMPPKNAAHIFNELDITLVVKIISHMKEIKVSNILSNMNLEKAKQVSIYLSKKI